MPFVSEEYLKKTAAVAQGFKELRKETIENTEKIAAAAEVVANTLVTQGHATELTKAASVKALMGHVTALNALNSIAQKGPGATKVAQELTVAESMGSAEESEKQAGTIYVNANTGEVFDGTTIKFYKDLEVI